MGGGEAYKDGSNLEGWKGQIDIAKSQTDLVYIKLVTFSNDCVWIDILVARTHNNIQNPLRKVVYKYVKDFNMQFKAGVERGEQINYL